VRVADRDWHWPKGVHTAWVFFYRTRALLIGFWALAWLLSTAAFTPDSPAPAPAVSITMVGDSALVLDSNKPCTDGPRAGFVSFRVRSTSGVSQSGLTATLSGFAGGITLGGG